MNDIVSRMERMSAQQRSALMRTLQTEGQRFGVAPLSFTQQRMWLLNQFDPGSAAYHVSAVLHLGGPLDVPALQQALSALVARHAALRTAFAVLDAQVLQSVQARADVVLEQIDLGAVPAEQRHAVALQRAQACCDAPFDLTRPPLLRAALLRLGPQSHWLALSIHHIACDMVSMEIIQRELVALYDAQRQGRAAALSSPAWQYTDFARWQREAVDGAGIEAQAQFWRRQLDGLPARLELPVDHAAPAAPSLRGCSFPYRLDGTQNAALRDLAKRRGATPFMVILAGYAALLQRLTGQRDIVIGSPISNRERPEWSQVVGYFLNTLLLRIDLGGQPTFDELIARVREVCLDAYGHADLPFERLVDLLQPGREMGRRPLFQALFIHQHRPPAEVSAAGLVWRYVDLPIRTMVADIGLWSVDSTDALEGFLAYDADLFEPASAQRIAARFQTLMADLLAHPDRPVERATWIPAAERQAVAQCSRAVPVELGPDACLHELIAAQAARTPHADAVVFGEQTLSYRELDRRANALAHHLRSLGVVAESRVALLLERSPELMVALLAVLKAGGAYVPLDPSYPQERLAYMLADSGAAVLLSTAATLPAAGPLPATTGRVLLDTCGGAAVADEPPDRVATPDTLAYVIYTSGSTGRPKGAMNAHRGVVNRLRWMQQAYPLNADDRVLQKTPSSFDVSVWEFFWPLMTGATLVLARPGGHRDPAYLAELIAEQRITTLHFVPSMFRAFLEQPDVERLASLRRVFCSGEALTPDLVQRFLSRSKAALHNLYGPTEAAVDVTFWPCSLNDVATVPIGRPVANTSMHVLDDRMQPVPFGVPGELYIGGVQVGRGYLGRAALTAERFVPDPFAGGGARLYRTGDRARLRADGAIEYLGRNDHQVKIRGLRIELGEIEATLCGHPQVAAAAVVDQAAPSGERLLAAYVQAREGAQESDLHDEQARVGDWAAVFDQAYAAGGEVDPGFDISAWVSSYDGKPVPAREMHDYVDSRIEAIRALQPRRVLEIGCGTGLLLLRLAPDCERYVGTDISRVGLAKIAAAVAARPDELGHVQLCERDALDLSGWEDGAFDTVILNSVIQMFPGRDYLERVLDGLQRVVAPGGCIFVGDVRRLDLHRLCHVSIQAHRAAADTSRAELRERVHAAMTREKDLVVSLDLFRAWATRDARRHAVFELERGEFHNEFTRFRCDALLYLDRAPDEDGDCIAWEADLTPGALRERLAACGGRAWITDIPDARIAGERATQEWMDEDGADFVGALASRAAPTGVDPDVLHGLARQLECRLSLRPARSGRAGTMDALFTPLARQRRVAVGELGRPAVPADAVLSNEALRASDEHSLAPRLATFLRKSLPEYMVPDRFIFLPELPLSPSGKVDRRRLPVPAELTVPRDERVAPRDDIERRLLVIWEALLGVRGFGVRDSFFALGGQSILAARLMARIRSEFRRTLPLSTLFEGATIEHLAGLLRKSDGIASRALVQLRPPADARGQDLPRAFFCVHAGGGSVLAYRDLATHLLPLDPARPARAFHAFQALGMDGSRAPLDSFEDMAAHYIREMRTVQPEGPYLLGGWCTGGRIAHTMARQLEAQGERVAMLALFDAAAVPQGLPDGDALDDTDLLGSMSPAFAEAAAGSGAAAHGRDRLADMVERLRAGGLIPPEAGLAQIRDMLVVFRAILRAERSHEPGRYDGPLTLFRAAAQPPGTAADLGWSAWRREPLAIVDVPGDHLSMMETPANAALLARALEDVLAGAEHRILEGLAR